MIRFYPQEEFKEFTVEGYTKSRLALSNRGRIVFFTDEIEKGELAKLGSVDGYQVIYLYTNANGVGKSRTLFLYKLLAEHFIPKTAEDQNYVIHLDFSRDNDKISNLKWVNYREKMEHYKKSPHVANGRKKTIAHNIKADGRKLTETTVIRLKKILLDPNRKTRMRILAKRFGVSEMQLYRIKRGENWGHIQVAIPAKKNDE